jgi:hypothetical protein
MALNRKRMSRMNVTLTNRCRVWYTGNGTRLTGTPRF